MNKKRSFSVTLCALLAAVVLAGCYQPVDFPEIVATTPAEPRVPVPAPVPRYRVVGRSAQGRPISCLVLGQGGDVTLILATIHGNEPAGKQLVRRLARYLEQDAGLLAGRRVVLLPVANPDGMAYGSRYNARGVDLNRNFATANRINGSRFGQTALSEPEARTIQQVIRQYSPDRIVSIHQPVGCIDYDGPALPLARRMAQYCDLRVRKLGAKPGSLGSYAGLTLGLPIITFEMLSGDEQLDAELLWQRYGSALLAAVVYPERVQAGG